MSSKVTDKRILEVFARESSLDAAIEATARVLHVGKSQVEAVIARQNATAPFLTRKSKQKRAA